MAVEQLPGHRDSRCPLCTESRSMPCSVVLRVVSSSASNTGEASISRITRLVRDDVGQSAAPIRRSA
jgi:hypothetical protein